ncbi:hypothetical protein ACFSR9_14785 [Deinococcus taklimakanensis]|uniref:Uncharacterized protein n=1 Tax=Deinococcus taklimakanensis TaxID=536443 RepID=A0ABW5P638_9DEIO
MLKREIGRFARPAESGLRAEVKQVLTRGGTRRIFLFAPKKGRGGKPEKGPLGRMKI